MDLTGQRFGKLVATYETKDGDGRPAWACRCDCGSVDVVVVRHKLPSGRAKSCGCLGQGKKQNLSGQRFGRLTALERVAVGTKTAWQCRCDCGAEAVVSTNKLRSGHTRSCGCLSREAVAARSTKHGMSNTRTYRIWYGMLTRCTKPRSHAYSNYGGRGIRVCHEWLGSFESFVRDMGEAGRGMSLERRDNDGDYCPANCYWLRRAEQGNNRRVTKYLTYKGERKTLRDWARIHGLGYHTVAARVRRGWPEDKWFSPPGSSRKTGPVGRKYGQKEKARGKLAHEVAMGRVVKPSACTHPGCDRADVQAHHHNGYTDEAATEVVWLCPAHHPNPREKRVTWQGRTMSLREWAIETGVPRRVLYARLQYRKWVVDDAIFGPPFDRRRLITFNGETMGLKEWAERVGISVSALGKRLSRGLSVEEALRPTAYAARRRSSPSGVDNPSALAV